jgi:DNA polymerase III subunit delta'
MTSDTRTSDTTATQSLAPLPWHEAVWHQLTRAWGGNRWPHGLLLHGPEGVGKLALAHRIAHGLLCDQSGDTASGVWEACGRCTSCQLLRSNTHPDLMLVGPEEGKQQISVDRIRESCAGLALTSYRSGYKVAIVAPAHQMTNAAANSLLKTLEEPGARTTLILVTDRSGALLPTIRSRCQQIAIRAPQESVALAWVEQTSGKHIPSELLRFANGAPLRALAMIDGRYEALWNEVTDDIAAVLAGRHDVTHIAKRWGNESLPERLTCVDRWLTFRIREGITGTAEPITSVPLPSDARELNINRLYACLDRVRGLQATLNRTALQRELAVDALLVDLLEAIGPRSH